MLVISVVPNCGPKLWSQTVVNIMSNLNIYQSKQRRQSSINQSDCDFICDNFMFICTYVNKSKRVYHSTKKNYNENLINLLSYPMFISNDFDNGLIS